MESLVSCRNQQRSQELADLRHCHGSSVPKNETPLRATNIATERNVGSTIFQRNEKKPDVLFVNGLCML